MSQSVHGCSTRHRTAFKWAVCECLRVDVLRRSDDQNGPSFLSLHRWQENRLSAKYFWRHELILSTLLHFPALVDRTSCPAKHLLMCASACTHLHVCAGGGALLHCYFKCYKKLRRKMTGVELLQWVQRSISAVLFPSSNPLHFTLLKHTEKTTYWVTQAHLESNLRYYADSRAGDGVLPLNYTVSPLHYRTCCCISVGRRGYWKEWVRLNDGSRGVAVQHILSQRLIWRGKSSAVAV